jgi:hypothetical protein
MLRPDRFTSNKQAQQIKEDYLKYTAQPFGKAAGITESPYYKGEALNRLAAFVSEYADRGADFISQQTGVPKSDVQNMMETLGIGVGIKAAPTVARAGLKGCGGGRGRYWNSGRGGKTSHCKGGGKIHAH